jgi:hypothetical protein
VLVVMVLLRVLGDSVLVLSCAVLVLEVVRNTVLMLSAVVRWEAGNGGGPTRPHLTHSTANWGWD